MEPERGPSENPPAGDPAAAFPDEAVDTGTTEEASIAASSAARVDAFGDMTGVDEEALPPPVPTGDPLARICPYLRSVDGTWRNSSPDPDHRCGSQIPPASLPLLAQERFCLTESHVRCEWFKMAESARQRALEQDQIPVERVNEARFRPAVRSVPLVLDAPETGTRRDSQGRRGIGRGWLIAAGVGLAAIAVVGLVLLALGSGAPAATPPATASSPLPLATSTLATPTTPAPTPSAATTQPPPSATPRATPLLVYYEVGADEGLKKIAAAFGITKRAILRVNDLGDPPQVEEGQRIVLPLPPGASPPPGTTLVGEAP